MSLSTVRVGSVYNDIKFLWPNFSAEWSWGPDYYKHLISDPDYKL
ncbi:butyrate-CoA ligase ['Chrysanthemum coronarium' phytoplasma]|uniref:Butyrate-CoA ligase n=1 Tax='Chrysanthemum coronarium' phytoplasma TaxID=1520703 RepID=A0ABQ0J1W3_9MOLU|nr:butyrate-CoA ligase ['Chrysanthemum coronarium' phytoplasma]